VTVFTTGLTASADVKGGTRPFTFSWYVDGILVVSEIEGAGTTALNLNGREAGRYNVSVIVSDGYLYRLGINGRHDNGGVTARYGPFQSRMETPWKRWNWNTPVRKPGRACQSSPGCGKEDTVPTAARRVQYAPIFTSLAVSSAWLVRRISLITDCSVPAASRKPSTLRA
jgi:hypothetical protein